MDSIDVRPITEADVEPLARYLTHKPNAQSMRNRFAEVGAGRREMLVAFLDGEPVGAVSIGGGEAELRPGALYLFALDVAPRHRRKGIATALIEAVESVARGRGLGAVDLKVGVENPNAARLHRDLGYELHGENVVDVWTEYTRDGTSIEMSETCAQMRKVL
ncbi:MAG: GNAT family N-acetyltransferase [Chloroflexi bacterium]|nr:GNAT family N-acetyltransferase [Chloroflexota bacterium]